MTGAPGSRNSRTLFPSWGLKSGEKQNSDTGLCRESPWQEWGPWVRDVVTDPCDYMAHCCQPPTRVPHQTITTGSMGVREPIAIVHFSQPFRAQGKMEKDGECTCGQMKDFQHWWEGDIWSFMKSKNVGYLFNLISSFFGKYIRWAVRL